MYEALLSKPRITRDVRLIRVPDAEGCSICGRLTNSWAEAKDVPLCVECADKTTIPFIPSKREWLTSLGYSLDRNWIPRAEAYQRKSATTDN